MQTFDSNGPDVRIRGSAFQVHEKYLQLARDASSSGDRIMAENYLQHAEHYYRIIAVAQEQQAQQQANDPNRRFRQDGYNGQDFRGGQSDEDGTSEVLDGFPTDEQIEGQQPPRGDNYRQEGRQHDGRQHDGRQHDDRRNDDRRNDGRQHDGRQYDSRQNDGRQNDGRGQDGRGRDGRHHQQDPGYRPQSEMQFRGEGAQPEGNYRQDRDREADGSRQYEERPRVRTFDDRQGGHGNGHGDGDHQSNGGEHVPVTPVQIEFPQPVMSDAAPANDEQPEAAAAPVRRGRPRRPKVETSAEPAEG